jgi:hypothetical protein
VKFWYINAKLKIFFLKNNCCGAKLNYKKVFDKSAKNSFPIPPEISVPWQH